LPFAARLRQPVERQRWSLRTAISPGGSRGTSTADDSAGVALSQTPVGTLILAIAAAAAERLAPVPLIALLKHPLAGGTDESRQSWLAAARRLDLALRGPRPPAGLDALATHLAGTAAALDWPAWVSLLEPIDRLGEQPSVSLGSLVSTIREAVQAIAGDGAWSGPAGRLGADLVAALEQSSGSAMLAANPDEWVPLLRDLMDSRPVRKPYGDHPRIAILGLIEARLQHADLMILGGLNEGSWPALPSPDPWLAPQVRARLGLPLLDHAAAQDLGHARRTAEGRSVRLLCPVDPSAGLARSARRRSQRTVAR
jgi:ATP-dependent helicase/nuclease subunit B